MNQKRAARHYVGSPFLFSMWVSLLFRSGELRGKRRIDSAYHCVHCEGADLFLNIDIARLGAVVAEREQRK